MLLVSLLSTVPSVYANQCLGDPNVPEKDGNGTKDEPYQLVYGYDLCDITLVKSADADDKDKAKANKAFPDDTIYFEYKFKNVPFKGDSGKYDNGLVITFVVNEKSSMTIGPVYNTLGAACLMAYDATVTENKKYKANYYDGGCVFNKTDDSPDTLSGKVGFSISIKDGQQIKRFFDEHGKLQKGPHGGYLGAGVIRLGWVKPPVFSPFSNEY